MDEALRNALRLLSERLRAAGVARFSLQVRCEGRTRSCVELTVAPTEREDSRVVSVLGGDLDAAVSQALDRVASRHVLDLPFDERDVIGGRR